MEIRIVTERKRLFRSPLHLETTVELQTTHLRGVTIERKGRKKLRISFLWPSPDRGRQMMKTMEVVRPSKLWIQAKEQLFAYVEF